MTYVLVRKMFAPLRYRSRCATRSLASGSLSFNFHSLFIISNQLRRKLSTRGVTCPGLIGYPGLEHHHIQGSCPLDTLRLSFHYRPFVSWKHWNLLNKERFESVLNHELIISGEGKINSNFFLEFGMLYFRVLLISLLFICLVNAEGYHCFDLKRQINLNCTFENTVH